MNYFWLPRHMWVLLEMECLLLPASYLLWENIKEPHPAEGDVHSVLRLSITIRWWRGWEAGSTWSWQKEKKEAEKTCPHAVWKECWKLDMGSGSNKQLIQTEQEIATSQKWYFSPLKDKKSFLWKLFFIIKMLHIWLDTKALVVLRCKTPTVVLCHICYVVMKVVVVYQLQFSKDWQKATENDATISKWLHRGQMAGEEKY